jgi:hypothetical protein
MSSPSTLPWKFRPLARSSSAACLTVSLPARAEGVYQLVVKEPQL